MTIANLVYLPKLCSIQMPPVRYIYRERELNVHVQVVLNIHIVSTCTFCI